MPLFVYWEINHHETLSTIIFFPFYLLISKKSSIPKRTTTITPISITESRSHPHEETQRKKEIKPLVNHDNDIDEG